MKSFRIVLYLTLFLLTVTPTAAVQAQQSFPCLRPSTLGQQASVNASACFTVARDRGSTALRVDLVVSAGAYDLYVTQGSASALDSADKVNVGAISGRLTYVYPDAGPLTVAVVRTSSSGSAQLSRVAYQATLKCGGSMCTASYPLTAIPGPGFNDQAIFGLPGAQAGRIDVKATWTGNARLSALLYGPSVTRTGVTQTAVARKDGSSPLALTYSVRSANLVSGGQWAVGLSNAGKAGGAVRSGTLTVTYPQ